MPVAERKIIQTPKRLYKQLYTAPRMRNDLWGGRGRGGSHEATEYALFRLTSPSYCRIAFVRKVLNDVRHSLWRDFNDRVEEARQRGSYLPEADLRIADNAMEATYYPTGNMVKCFGVKADGGRTAKLKSLAGYNLVIIEECDELTEEEYNQLEDSLRTTKGEIPPMVIRVFNPPGRLHWIWKDYNLLKSERPGYWRASPKSGMNILSIHANYKSNLKNLDPSKVEKWARYEQSNPEYFYTLIEGLISEGQRGRVYDGWNPITDETYRAVDARPIWWLDFGFSEDPMAFGEAKFAGNKMYCREHVYRPMRLIDLAIEWCKLGITGQDLVIADSEDTESIGRLRNGWSASELTPEQVELYPQLMRGFYVVAAQKGPGSIRLGIDKMKELNVLVTESSGNIWNEYREYRWALDKDKNPTDMPEDKNNHHMDGMRYLALGRGRLF